MMAKCSKCGKSFDTKDGGFKCQAYCGCVLCPQCTADESMEVKNMITCPHCGGSYIDGDVEICLLYTSPSPRDVEESRMPSSA